MCKTKEAQEYLKRFREVDGDILNLLAEAKRWKEIAQGLTAGSQTVKINGIEHAMDRVQSSGSQQRMADAVCEYIDIEEDIKRRLAMYATKRNEILDVIRKLPYDKRNVIHKRYVQNLSFDEISLLCDKSRSWVTSIHGRALQDVQNILDERKKDE